MQFIRDIHNACHAEGRPAFSFEFFPPKTPEGEAALFERTLPELLKLKPDYCSVTYGAGGSTREKTLGIVDRIQREHGLTAMMHLTCVNSTAAQLGEAVDAAYARGIRNLLALRGDPPGGGEWTKVEGGFEYSSELVAFLKQRGGYCIGTAGFPEGHVACKEGREVDWRRVADKINAGADFVITQLFFDNDDFFRFHDFLTGECGVTVPIIPGMLPVLSRSQTRKFCEMCGASLPAKFFTRLEATGDDDAAATQFGIDYTVEQCEALLRFGVSGLHFYTLNKAHSTAEVARRLGLGKK